MKALWEVHSEYREYNYRTWLLDRIEVHSQFLWTHYKQELFMFKEKKSSDELKPYFMLTDVDKNEVVLRVSEEIDGSSPFPDHWDEVTESLWDDVIDWILSHR